MLTAGRLACGPRLQPGGWLGRARATDWRERGMSAQGGIPTAPEHSDSNADASSPAVCPHLLTELRLPPPRLPAERSCHCTEDFSPRRAAGKKEGWSVCACPCLCVSVSVECLHLCFPVCAHPCVREGTGQDGQRQRGAPHSRAGAAAQTPE